MRKENMDSLKKKYEGEWLLIVNVDVNEIQQPIRGNLIAHSKRKADIYEKLLDVKTGRFAIEYTGEIPKDYVVMF